MANGEPRRWGKPGASLNFQNLTTDYSLYSYAINWRPYVLGSSMQNCGFRIFYEPPHVGIALPMIQRNYP
jgi:hypothetical protein